ncbi:MAG: (d)CMP kinase [Bacteroidales bacterium]|jgi:cytidylate kinase|nr:(d)CMP kinase [Bacteroidales bacterium]MBR3064795.1 (d)CMP kinase [Bacteroidales bacterium]
MEPIIIAIDGYSSTGKGTFAVEIARRLGILYLDSGALYRTVTLYALQNGQIEWNGEILYRKLQEDILLGKIDISVLPKKDGTMRIFLSDEDVSGKIRELEVARNVSAIATLPFVRNFVDEQLHRLGAKGCVMDGRDIGTAVFPNANLKIFMTADAEIRAQRRVKQMEEAGQHPNFAEILKNVQERDYIDSHRAMNPLRKADDAIVLDNSHMTVEEQLVWLDGILRERFNLSLL